MIATLKINLGEALTAEEFRDLTQAAIEEGKPIERLLFDAVRDICARRKSQPQPEGDDRKAALVA